MSLVRLISGSRCLYGLFLKEDEGPDPAPVERRRRC
jgi:hypothetical protein